MMVIDANTVQDAWSAAVAAMCNPAVWETEQSRNGPVRVWPTPVTTVYRFPRCRVLRDPVRNPNPFFHLMESLWMLAGRNDVKWISDYLQGMAKYSDNGETFHGAYGFRWRYHFLEDQLNSVVRMLRFDPTTRRCVIQMWDTGADLDANYKDLPCNLLIVPRIHNSRLDITVMNRSNDIIWGCYGANVVHMSMLHEYLAMRLNCAMGRYYQISNNWHVYDETWDKYKEMYHQGFLPAKTYVGEPMPFLSVGRPSMEFPDLWEHDMRHFVDTKHIDPLLYHTQFFKTVVCGMQQMFETGVPLENCLNNDWLMAGSEWLKQRDERRREKNGR